MSSDGPCPAVYPEFTAALQSRQTENQDASGRDDSKGLANNVQTMPNFMVHTVNAAVPDELLRWYWQNVHPYFPILHRQIFEAEYSRLGNPRIQTADQGRDPEELVFYATLNIVLALSCQRNETISLAQRHYQANEFYGRSKGLISVETLDASSLSLVQLLLLRSLYLYFDSRTERCWIMLGMAIRMAIFIGLNNPCPGKGVPGQLEREMRRRVWHCGCFRMDQ